MMIIGHGCSRGARCDSDSTGRRRKEPKTGEERVGDHRKEGNLKNKQPIGS